MTRPGILVVLAVAVLLLAGGVCWWLGLLSNSNRQVSTHAPGSTPGNSGGSTTVGVDNTSLNNTSGISGGGGGGGGGTTPVPAGPSILNYGRAPWVSPTANEHTRSIAKAYGTPDYPKRVSVLHGDDKPFDAAAYRANPEAYLQVVEPSRAFRPAQPGHGVNQLSPMQGRVIDVEQGNKVKLQVLAVPGAPVTFTSTGMGAFDNQLTSITVAANEQGVATVRFTATAGTIDDVPVLVASPLTSGQVRYRVRVSLPAPGSTPGNSGGSTTVGVDNTSLNNTSGGKASGGKASGGTSGGTSWGGD